MGCHGNHAFSIYFEDNMKIVLGCRVGYIRCQSMREFAKCQIWTAKYSGWSKSIQIGANFSYIKQCKFTSTLLSVYI